MPQQLDPSGNPVDLGSGVVITTPGLQGQAEVYQPTDPGMRAVDNSSSEFLEALSWQAITEELTVEISDHQELDDVGASRAVGGNGDIELDVPSTGADWAQVAMYTAEDGTVSWHFPEGTTVDKPADRAADSLHYRIPRAITPSAGGPDQRGLFGALGKKLIKILSFAVKPLIEVTAGKIADFVETRKHLDSVRTFAVGEYRNPGQVPTPQQWADLGSGRALLFIHGTLSRSQTGFGSIRPEIMQKLAEAYGRRVFALDHSTVSKTPTENAQFFMDSIPAGVTLDIDVITHSRGGLVGRALARLAAQSGDRLTIGKIVMVAPPNAGTVLVDVKELEQFLNRYTSFLQLLPDNTVTDVLNVLLAIVQQVALAAYQGMAGLMSMNPSMAALQAFNQEPNGTPTYFAAGSNFEPAAGSAWAAIARDGATDAVFGSTPNDLVVPRDGTFQVPGAPGYPIVDPLLFQAADAVDHSGYWPKAAFEHKLQEWLQVPQPYVTPAP